MKRQHRFGSLFSGIVLASVMVSMPAQSDTTIKSKVAMSSTDSVMNSLPGLIYSSAFSDMVGLDSGGAVDMDKPLLAAALDISKGISGANLCRLHLFLDNQADIRLPAEDNMLSVGPHVGQLPFSVIKKPSPEVRKEISLQVRKMANRAIIRFGNGALSMPVVAGEDTAGTYTSFPLDGYDKSFLSGVTWVVMGINCAVAAEGNFDSVTMYFEKQASAEGMIVNQQIDPFQLTSVEIPTTLFKGMQGELMAATEEDAQGVTGASQEPRFRVISD